MNNWLIPVRTDKFDFENAFAELEDNCVDEQQANSKYQHGDIAYLYCSPEKAIKYKCLIKDINIPVNESIDDKKYVKDKNYFAIRANRYKNCIRLQLFEKVNIEFDSFKNHLTDQRPLHNQQIINNDLLQNLNSITCIVDTDESMSDSENTITEKMQLSAARIGQGLFREKVKALDKKCIITGIEDTQLLIASHIKAWSESSNNERLDGNNGILLSPHLDKLFDKHLISFADNGKILFFNENIRDVLIKWNIDINKEYCQFSKERIKYLEYHRNKCSEINRHCT
jgi:predicted restriction endonuclease